MTEELPFRIALAALMTALFTLRIYYHRYAGTFRASQKAEREGWYIRAIRWVMLPCMIALLVYLIYPPAMAWASFPAPDWLRWLGVALGFLTFPLFAWIHWALGKNFNTTLYVRPDHTLVTHGPYRWVRHPMYTAIVLYMVAVGLITASWFLLITGVLIIGVVIVIRTPKEEALMIETFGDAYRAYQRRTGALWPRLLVVRS